jgi:ABC-type uncharacterized transport system permease subunit
VFPSSAQNWPVIGRILFGQNVLVYASWAWVALISLYLSDGADLNVRAVGESPAAAAAMGINVVAYRYAHTLAGGAFAGGAGATFTLAITPQWVAGITGGARWIAIALVIFALWRPSLCLVGAYLAPSAYRRDGPLVRQRAIELGTAIGEKPHGVFALSRLLRLLAGDLEIDVGDEKRLAGIVR